MGKLSEPRGFLLLFIKEKSAYLLLKSDKKKKRGEHFQLPGGRCTKDDNDEKVLCEYLSKKSRNRNDTKWASSNSKEAICRFTATREAFEETGIDLRGSPERLVSLDGTQMTDEESLMWPAVPIFSSTKNKFFFYVTVSLKSDGAAPQPEGEPFETNPPLDRFRLSEEHSGFKYEANLAKVAELVGLHSGGDCSEAVLALHRSGQENTLRQLSQTAREK